MASNYEAAVGYAGVVAERCREKTLLVYTSAVAVYGRGAPRRCGSPLVEENVHCACCRPSSHYARAKLFAERVLSRIASDKGVAVVAARMGVFAGRRPYHPEWRLLLSLAGRRFYLASNALLNITAAEHLVDTIEFLRPPPGRFMWLNLVSHVVEARVLTRLLAERLSGSAWPLPSPGRRFAKLLSLLAPGLASDVLWTLYTPVHSRLRLPEPPPLENVVDELVAEEAAP